MNKSRIFLIHGGCIMNLYAYIELGGFLLGLIRLFVCVCGYNEYGTIWLVSLQKSSVYNVLLCAAVSPRLVASFAKETSPPNEGLQQYTTTHCNTLQHTATYCNILQHAATLCNTLQFFNFRVLLRSNLSHRSKKHLKIERPPYTATRCSTLQHTAAHCNTLQHTATHCSTL